MIGPPLLTGRFDNAEISAIWSDDRLIDACLEVEIAWIAAVVEAGKAPRGVAEEAERLATRLRGNWRRLVDDMAATGRPVVPLVAALAEAGSVELGKVLHLGLTTQDVLDAALARLSAESMARIAVRGRALADALGGLAHTHRDTPMLGRSNGQAAAVITFGLLPAGWRAELLRGLDRIDARGHAAAATPLAGPVRLSRPFGSATDNIRADAARRLGLKLLAGGEAPARDRTADLCLALTLLCQSLGRMGETIGALMSHEIGELIETGPGGESSAMPGKRNPRLPERLIALATRARDVAPGAMAAMLTRHQRSGESWSLEWAALPELFALAGTSVQTGHTLLDHLQVDEDRMRDTLDRAGDAAVADRALVDRALFLGRRHALAEPGPVPTEDLMAQALRDAAAAVDRLIADPADGRGTN